MSKWFAMSLYFTSFAPLWLSILFIEIKSICVNQDDRWTEIMGVVGILVLSVFCLSTVLLELHIKGKEGTSFCKIESAKEEKTITAEYLLSYILPLFAFDFTTWDSVILFLIFYITLGFLCIKHNYFSVNIVLELAGFRFYNCILKNEDNAKIEKLVISHKKLNGCVGDYIYIKLLNNEYGFNVE